MLPQTGNILHLVALLSAVIAKQAVLYNVCNSVKVILLDHSIIEWPLKDMDNKERKRHICFRPA